jgi:hypothetical protein
MKAKVTFRAIEGRANAYVDRTSDTPIVLYPGEKVTLDVVEPKDESVEAAVEHARYAPGVGGNKGLVEVTAGDVGLRVRQYLQTNAFMEPDEPDYIDHKLAPGEKYAGELVTSNALTFIVEGTL